MDIEHAADSIGGDDHETVVIPSRRCGCRKLSDGSAENRFVIRATNQPRLSCFIFAVDPFKPVVHGHNQAMSPDRPEERTMGDFLYPGIDRWWAILGPVRAPAPAQIVGMQ